MHPDVRYAIQFWAVLTLILFCAMFRAGHDGLVVLSAGAIGTVS